MTGLAFDGTTGIVNATWTTLTRPGTAVAGQSGYNTDTGAFETFNGSTWGYTTGTWNTAGRPTNPVAGLTGFNTTYGGFEVWNGTAWSTISGGPAFSAYQSAAAQTLSNLTSTKITFDVEEFDTNNNFSGSTFTPTIPGYYIIAGSIYLSTTSTSATAIYQTMIYKNGSMYKRTQGLMPTAAVAQSGGTEVGAVIYCNGTTDYIELWAITSTSPAASSTTSTGISNTFFTGSLVRGV